MNNAGDLKRSFGLLPAIAIVIGSVIGSGIFVRPADMAALLGTPALIFLAWVAAAAFSFFNALIQAEIGAMIPKTGGQYTFMRYMFGNFWAYLYGWASFAVINTAGTASIAFICAEYSNYFLHLPRFSAFTEHSWMTYIPAVGKIYPLENFGIKLLTIVYLCILTLINYRSTKAGSRFQSVLTAVKLGAILFIIGGFFMSGKGTVQHFSTVVPGLNLSGFSLIAAFAAACTGALFSFDGWGNVIFMVGEIKWPQRNLPLALMGGLLICTLCYIGITAAYIFMLPLSAIAHSSLVASDAASVAFGVVGGGIISGFIVISTLGCVNANVLTAPRLTYSMAKTHEFFPSAAKIHPVFETPSSAFLLHLGWMIFTVLIGSFYLLADMFIFVTWCFNLMMIIGLFRLRRKMPDVPRPFKVWGYPWLPFLVLLGVCAYLVLTLYNDITAYNRGMAPVINSVFGIILTLLGIPLRLYFKVKGRNTAV
jgi:APA family basic amino acid/polyamine antiporter